MDDKQSKEIDRVFEKYKALSEQQKLSAQNKPMKERTLDIGNKAPTPSSAKEKASPSAKPAGIAGILDQYFQSKENRTKTNSVRFKTPENMND